MVSSIVVIHEMVTLTSPLALSEASFKLFAPRLYERYREVLSGVRVRDGNLRPPFENNVFAAATFNLGGDVTTLIHTDHLNYAPGWCAIVALGKFDPDKGGHLIIWDLGIAIRFPPGSLIFLPSAILRHSNVALAPGDTRYSFTQYTAGGIFRWSACGFQSQRSFLAQGGQHEVTGWERWQSAITQFSTVAELSGTS